MYRTYLGGANIDKFYGKAYSENSNFPEDWTASVIKAFNPGREDIEEGLGKISDEIMVKDVIKGEIKYLVKLLDAAERLVIQVHPSVILIYNDKVSKKSGTFSKIFFKVVRFMIFLLFLLNERTSLLNIEN